MQPVFLEKSTQTLIKESIPSEQICSNLSSFYSVFSDSTRLKILISLLTCEMCVNDLSKLLGINQTTLSHQLKILKSNGAVTTTRRNKYIFYKATNKFVNNIMINGVDFYLEKTKKIGWKKLNDNEVSSMEFIS